MTRTFEHYAAEGHVARLFKIRHEKPTYAHVGTTPARYALLRWIAYLRFLRT